MFVEMGSIDIIGLIESQNENNTPFIARGIGKAGDIVEEGI